MASDFHHFLAFSFLACIFFDAIQSQTTSQYLTSQTSNTQCPTCSSSAKPVSVSSSATSDFPHFSTLDPAGSFGLFWKYDDENITFRVYAATKGWAGIGFSPNGGMPGSDIVVFWIDGSGKAVISDRYATEFALPKEDAQQDYMLIDGAKNATHLIFTFSRKRNTCDQQDWQLTDGTTRVIYASNDAVPQSKASFMIHTVRGSKSLHIFDDKPSTDKPLPEKDARSIDFRVNKVNIPDNIGTTYWCEIATLAKFDKKMQVIKVDPLIEPQNVDIVHHIIIYMCSTDMSSLVGQGRSCFKDGEEDDVFDNCKQSVMAGWAVGGESTTYPDNIGFPLYADVGSSYVMLEMHYDNSAYKKGKVDSSGMRLWVTETLRPIDSGQVTLGIPVGADEQVIPPGQKEFTNYGYCSAQCTAGFPPDGIKVLGGFLHTHLAGRKLRVSHFRNGKQLPPVLADEHYDFNYQDSRRLKEPTVILPGDDLVLECVYETLDRTNATFSGPSTHDEMCLAFLDYYPAIYRGFMCLSTPDKRKLYKQLGVDIAPLNISNPSDISVPMPDGTKKPLAKYLRQDFRFDWSQLKIDQLQKGARDFNHTVICLRHDINKSEMNFTPNALGKIEGFDLFNQPGYPVVTDPLVLTDVCTGKKVVAGVPDRDEKSNQSIATSSVTNQSISPTPIVNQVISSTPIAIQSIASTPIVNQSITSSSIAVSPKPTPLPQVAQSTQPTTPKNTGSKTGLSFAAILIWISILVIIGH